MSIFNTVIWPYLHQNSTSILSFTIDLFPLQNPTVIWLYLHQTPQLFVHVFIIYLSLFKLHKILRLLYKVSFYSI